jgi:hypothetical protein
MLGPFLFIVVAIGALLATAVAAVWAADVSDVNARPRSVARRPKGKADPLVACSIRIASMSQTG